VGRRKIAWGICLAPRRERSTGKTLPLVAAISLAIRAREHGGGESHEEERNC